VHLRARAHGSRRCRERGFDDLGFSDEDELERRVGFEGAQGAGRFFVWSDTGLLEPPVFDEAVARFWRNVASQP